MVGCRTSAHSKSPSPVAPRVQMPSWMGCSFGYCRSSRPPGPWKTCCSPIHLRSEPFYSLHPAQGCLNVLKGMCFLPGNFFLNKRGKLLEAHRPGYVIGPGHGNVLFFHRIAEECQGIPPGGLLG